eukprot:scaffold1883_cov261-Pinguiococcus_pyrenoidosus.AAC.25
MTLAFMMRPPTRSRSSLQLSRSGKPLAAVACGDPACSGPAGDHGTNASLTKRAKIAADAVACCFTITCAGRGEIRRSSPRWRGVCGSREERAATLPSVHFVFPVA